MWQLKVKYLQQGLKSSSYSDGLYLVIQPSNLVMLPMQNTSSSPSPPIIIIIMEVSPALVVSTHVL